MSFYLDCSAIAPAFIEEGTSTLIRGFLATHSNALNVSHLAVAEMASVISRLVRMNTLAAKDAKEILADFDFWRVAATAEIDLEAADARLANMFVRRFELKLRTPDALHAAICRRIGATLVTLDQRLADAAGALGIACIVPEP